MARQVLTPQDTPGAYVADGTILAVTVADPVNKEEMKLTGQEIILAFNAAGVSATVSVDSVDNVRGRPSDISAAVQAAGVWGIYGPFGVDGWQQSGGVLFFEANNSQIEYSTIRLPAQFKAE